MAWVLQVSVAPRCLSPSQWRFTPGHFPVTLQGQALVPAPKLTHQGTQARGKVSAPLVTTEMQRKATTTCSCTPSSEGQKEKAWPDYQVLARTRNNGNSPFPQEGAGEMKISGSALTVSNCHGGSTYTSETCKCYKSGLPPTPESWLLNIYPHNL